MKISGLTRSPTAVVYCWKIFLNEREFTVGHPDLQWTVSAYMQRTETTVWPLSLEPPFYEKPLLPLAWKTSITKFIARHPEMKLKLKPLINSVQKRSWIIWYRVRQNEKFSPWKRPVTLLSPKCAKVSIHHMGALHVCDGTVDIMAYDGKLEIWTLTAGISTRPHSAHAAHAILCVCIWLTCVQFTSVSVWKCIVHNK